MSATTAVRHEYARFMAELIKRNPGEPEFHQAVQEVAESLIPFVLEHSEYKRAQILERLTEPDRVIIFRVPWEDDRGTLLRFLSWRRSLSLRLDVSHPGPSVQCYAEPQN